MHVAIGIRYIDAAVLLNFALFGQRTCKLYDTYLCNLYIYLDKIAGGRPTLYLRGLDLS